MKKHVLAVIGLVLFLLYLLAALGSVVGSPDTVTVDSTTDVNDGDTSSISNLIAAPGSDGVISLREAIEAANNTAGSDTIEFNIPIADPGYMVSGITGTWTISLTTYLPYLSGGGTVIRGDTQAVNVPAYTNPNGPEIEISGVGMASGNCLTITSADNVIHGLVINRCLLSGILISGSGATTNTVSGNYIGTDATGSFDLGNSNYGVFILDGAQNNVIGGDTPEERNIISENEWSGVLLWDSGTMSNTISGNYIGTDASGSSDLGNSNYGVYIGGGAQNNTIGGDSPEERNIISGNNSHGVVLSDTGTNGNTISGNYIGTDASGSLDLGNSQNGVVIEYGAQNNVIGGDASGERNIISGNGWSGVKITGSETMSNTVSGNYIGTDAAGSLDLGNSYHGVDIWAGAQNNVIGGGTPEERNVIAFSGVGVYVDDATTTGNTITQNSIHSNTGLGIDLVNGGNADLAAPTISAANTCFVAGTAVTGQTIEVFTGPDDEGKTYLTTVSADGSGDWSASDSFTLDTYVTATATDASGNTSEFSAAVPSGTCYQIFLPLIMKSY